MASTFTVNRAHLIYGLCLPLALLLGYLLAEPLESSSLAVVVLVLSVLITPLLMKWYHPVLVVCWNSAFYLPFLPGSPPAWVALAALGAVFMLLNRCVDSKRRLMAGGAVAWSLVGIAVVVVVTALLTGGIGLKAMGSSTFGGRKYVYVAAAILGYFVLTSQQLPRNRAAIYVGLFFLSGATSLIGEVAYHLGFHAAFYLISPATVNVESDASFNYSNLGFARLTTWVSVSNGVCLFFLARYGCKGIMNFARPWRLMLVAVFLVAGLYGGFRSFIGFIILVFAVAFFLEGLHRTRYLIMVGVAGIFCAAALVGFATKMPLPIQRAFSFLPIEISPVAASSAQSSLSWRFDMWKEVAGEVPRYLLKGKGYVIDPGEMYFSQIHSGGFELPAEWAIVAGDYHNGPLSVLIPFGIWGALALGWFLFASIRLLCRYCTHGDSSLLLINRAILACFIARLILFLFLVGGISSDLPYFVSLIGLAVCLNGEDPKKAVSEQSGRRDYRESF